VLSAGAAISAGVLAAAVLLSVGWCALQAAPPMIIPTEHAVVGGAAITRIAAKTVDTDAGYLTTSNKPLDELLPVVSGAVPDDGLLMEPGLRPAFSLVMGGGQRGVNMIMTQSIRDRLFLNYIFGDYLHAVCSHNHAGCSPGHVWGVMVRLPFEWRPGMVMKVRYRSPKGDHSWTLIWMASGQQTPPKQGGDPWQGFPGPNALHRPGATGMEIDWNDNYSHSAAGVPTGPQIDFGTPDIYHAKWQTKPHDAYWANGNGWEYFGLSYKPEFEKVPFDWSGNFHDLVGNWRSDGSNLIDLIVAAS